jgi:hypothetical protein
MRTGPFSKCEHQVRFSYWMPGENLSGSHLQWMRAFSPVLVTVLNACPHWPVLHENPVPVFKPAGEDRPGSHLAFNIFGEFPQPGHKKKRGRGIQQRDFWDLKKIIRHILSKKNLEVARFRQCVPVGRQNWAGFQKRSTSPPGQSPFTAN